MAAVTIVMSGDDARLQAAHERLFAQQAKALENYQKSVNKIKEAQAQAEADLASRKAAAEAEKARLAVIEKGQKLIEGNRDAQERYNAALAEAEELEKAGAISKEDLARRTEILKKRLNEESGEAKKAKDAEAQLTEAHRKAEAVIKSIQTPLERYNARVKELSALQRQGALSAEEFARAQSLAKENLDDENAALAQKNDFLGTAKEQMLAYATGIGSAATIATALHATWKQITEEQKKGLEALKATQPADSNLLQISDNAQQFQQLRSESDQLSMQTGVDRTAVREVMFQGVSEGFKDAVPDIIKANQVIPVKEAAGVAGQIPALFQGQLKAMEAVDLTLAAAKASRLDFAPLARALPAAAEGGSIAKASPEETLATLSVLASRFKSGEAAADRIKAFAAVAGIDQGGKTAEQKKADADRLDAAQKELRRKEETVADIQRKIDKPGITKEAKAELEIKLTRAQRDVAEFDRSRLEAPVAREAFAGKGILEVVKELQAMTADDRQKFLGSSQELNAAYVVMVEEMPKIEKQVAELVRERAAFNQGGGILRDQIAIANSDREMSALREEAKAQRRLEVMQATADGVQGAASSGAAASAAANLRIQPLPTRVIGSMTTPIAAAGAAALGADQPTSAGFAEGLARGIASTFMGNFSGFQKVETGLDSAVSKFSTAVDKLDRSISNQPPQIPPSIAPLARDQAAAGARQ